MGIDVCMSGLWNVLYMYGGRSKGDMYTLKIKKKKARNVPREIHRPIRSSAKEIRKGCWS